MVGVTAKEKAGEFLCYRDALKEEPDHVTIKKILVENEMEMVGPLLLLKQ